MTAQIEQLSAKSVAASLLRQRKYALVRQYGIPENLIGGSLAPTYRRCGKPNCHCRTGRGHLQWSLTFCQHGRKRVERVPAEWVAQLESAVLEAQRYLDAVREVTAINIELLAQTRAQQRQKKVRRRPRKTQDVEINDQLFPAAIDPLNM
jgi:hypothetical protein